MLAAVFVSVVDLLLKILLHCLEIKMAALGLIKMKVTEGGCQGKWLVVCQASHLLYAVRYMYMYTCRSIPSGILTAHTK